MSDLINRQDAIDALSKEYRKDDSDYPTQYQLGLSKAKQIIQALPSALDKMIFKLERGQMFDHNSDIPQWAWEIIRGKK